MQAMGLLEWLGLAMVCLSSALIASAWLGRRQPVSAVPPAPPDPKALEKHEILLFEDNVLVDATTAGYAMLGNEGEGSDWSLLVGAVADRFVDFPTSTNQVRDAGQMRLAPRNPDDRCEARLEWLDGAVRVHIRPSDPPPEYQTAQGDAQSELAMLQSAADASPFPAWMLRNSGRVGWHNRAYRDLYMRLHGVEPIAEKPVLHTLLDSRRDDGTVRSSITVPGSEDTYWFDVTVVRQAEFSMFYAQDINAVVRAETAQRNFVQTLAKTFAQLSIGLAIFDRNRQLVLFNPALIDLTMLPADFLSARPDFLTFFDRLRDNQMMPEPKDYSTWRDQLADLVAAAADGRYQETWSLPSGSVYQVSGRPHPDGAVAFLFEDITAEVTLTRRFRSDLELGQSVLDHLDDAIAVFSPNGILAHCNAAYCNLWSVDPGRSFADVTVPDALTIWQEASADTEIWARIGRAISDPDDRNHHRFAFQMSNGQRMSARVRPVQGGATMIAFAPDPGAAPIDKTLELLSGGD